MLDGGFLSTKVSVFDHLGCKKLFEKTRTQATGMVERGVAFVLLQNPLEIALTQAPTKKVLDGRPDRSLTMPLSVMIDAADGVPSSLAIVNAYEANHQGHAQ
jgi:hypothetical protein